MFSYHITNFLLQYISQPARNYIIEVSNLLFQASCTSINAEEYRIKAIFFFLKKKAFPFISKLFAFYLHLVTFIWGNKPIQFVLYTQQLVTSYKVQMGTETIRISKNTALYKKLNK